MPLADEFEESGKCFMIDREHCRSIGRTCFDEHAPLHAFEGSAETTRGAYVGGGPVTTL